MAKSQRRTGNENGYVHTTVNGKEYVIQNRMQGSPQDTDARRRLALDSVTKAELHHDGEIQFRVVTDQRYATASDWVPPDYEILDVGIHDERHDGKKSFSIRMK